MADEAEILARSRNVSVMAPAGCGKTELIARAVRVDTGRQLVLTHTHAGVNALRRRMQRLRVPSGRYSIETIDGWALKLASSYPGLAQAPNLQSVQGDDWHTVREAATRLLGYASIHAIVSASYDGVYVDEYQDCGLQQHHLLTRLATIVPTRVLGDPLQGVFSFSGNECVDWDVHVTSVFPELMRLCTPHRWTGGNEDLGRWLLRLRECIYEDRSVDLSKAPVEWQHALPRQCLYGCKQCGHCDAFPTDHTVVLVTRWREQSRSVARTSGCYQAIEEMDCKDCRHFARQLDNSLRTPGVLGVVLKFVGACYTQSVKIRKSQSVQVALEGIARSGDVPSVLETFEAVQRSPIGRCYRHDLWREGLRTLRLYAEAPAKFASVENAAWHARDITRRVGRPLPPRLASTTLLVKGLQFDHAVIRDADNTLGRDESRDPMLPAKNFYVAATRGARSLTVMSADPVIGAWRL